MPADGDNAARRTRTDWLALLGLAQRLLGWSPETFWHATPIELGAALGRDLARQAPVGAMTRAEMMRLAEHLGETPHRCTEKGISQDE